MAVIGLDGRSYRDQAAADRANVRYNTMNLPSAPTSSTPPVAMASTASGQANQQLASGLNAGGQPLSAVQKANLQNMQNQLSGKTTPVQAAQIREQATADALKKSTTIDRFTSQDPARIAAQQKMNAQYGLDPLTGLRGEATDMQPGQTAPRDFAREAATAKKLGGPPTTEEETRQMLKATYSPDELMKMGLSSYVNPPVNTGNAAVVGAATGMGVQGANPGQYLSSQQLTDMGLTSDKLATLVKTGNISQAQADQIAKTGASMDTAQQLLNSIPKPTNSSIGVLEQALRIKNGIGMGDATKSDILAGAGFKQDLNPNSFFAGLDAKKQEMSSNYDFYKKVVLDKSGVMLDTWKTALDGYKAAQDSFNTQAALLTKANERLEDHKWALETMKQQQDFQIKAYERQKQIDAKYEKEKPDLQFIPESDSQAAGYFNKNTGEFTPLSVGGNSSGPVSHSSYLGSASSSDGSALRFDNPIPHGSANTLVSEANPSLIDIYENGFKKAAGANGYGGQCAYEAEQWVTLDGKNWSVGNTIQQKAASLDKYVRQGLGFYKGQGEPQVGYSVISNDDPKSGHVWVINAKTPDGKLVASEFNRAGSRVFSNNRIVDPNDKSILGFLRTEPKSQYQVEKETVAQKNIQKAFEGVQNIVKGKTQGGLLDFLTAGTGMALDVIKDQGQKSQKTQADALMKAKIDEGIKAGILDENGQPYSPDRVAVRSGAFTDTMLNQKYSELKKAVQKGIEPPEALNAFQQDLIYAQDKAKQIQAQAKLDEKYSQPMNENQGKSIGFAVSAKQAEGFMPKNGDDPSLGKLNDWTRNFKNDDIVSDKINEIKDPVAKQIAQAEMQWVQNVLRGESGAAISMGEYKTKGQTYFPRPGDTPEMIRNKKIAREQQVENLLVQGGPQGAKYWENLGNEVPPAIAKQFGMTVKPKNDSLGLFDDMGGGDGLGLGI